MPSLRDAQPGPSVMPRSEGVPPSIEEWRCAPSSAWQLPSLPPQQPKPAVSGVALPFYLPALQIQQRVAAGFKIDPAAGLEHRPFAEQRQRLGQQPRRERRVEEDAIPTADRLAIDENPIPRRLAQKCQHALLADSKARSTQLGAFASQRLGGAALALH